MAEAARSARRLARSGGVALALSRRPELPLVPTGAFARSLRAVAWGPEMPPDGGGFARNTDARGLRRTPCAEERGILERGSHRLCPSAAPGLCRLDGLQGRDSDTRCGSPLRRPGEDKQSGHPTGGPRCGQSSRMGRVCPSPVSSAEPKRFHGKRGNDPEAVMSRHRAVGRPQPSGGIPIGDSVSRRSARTPSSDR